MPNPITREEWLISAAELMLENVFKPKEFSLNGKPYAITCGFPSRGGLARKSRRIGECWHPSSSSDGTTNHIFISPTISDHVQVMGVIAHELVHVIVGTAAGHTGPFKRAARAIGLCGKMTATAVSKELALQFEVMKVEQLGAYPHIQLNGMNYRKQTTRLLKGICPDEDCGYIIRTTSKWVEDLGFPFCPCGQQMVQG